MLRSFGSVRALFQGRNQQRSRAASYRPLFEQLETRECLSTVNMVLYSHSMSNSFAGVGFAHNAVADLDAYVNGQQNKNPADFHAQIDWGDGGGWMPGEVALKQSSSYVPFQVKGSHVYGQLGTYSIRVQITGPDGSTLTKQTATASVSQMPSGLEGISPPVTAAAIAPTQVDVNLYSHTGPTSYAGVGFTNNVIADLDGSVHGYQDKNAADFRAYVNWGDSSEWSAADVVRKGDNSGTPFQVKGSHVYEQPGTYSIVVYAVGPDGTSLSKKTATAWVSQTPSGLPGTVPAPTANSRPPSQVSLNLNSHSLGSSYAEEGFTDRIVADLDGDLNGYQNKTAADYHAQINWGDSGEWHAAEVELKQDGSSIPFAVRGSHVYAQAGTYAVVVHVTGPDGTSLTRQTGTAFVQANPNPPPAPTNLQATADCHKIVLSWNAADRADGYHVFRRVGTAWQQIAVCDSTTTSFTVGRLAPGSSYELTVSAFNENGGTTANPLQATTAYRPISVAQLQAIMPAGLQNAVKAQNYADALNNAMRAFGITTPARQAAFLAQIAQETSHLRWVREAGWLSPAKRATYFNSTYARRKDIWDPARRVDFTGRGVIPLTGRANYQAVTDGLRALGYDYDFVKNPNLLVTDAQASALAAGWYWQNRSGYPTKRGWVGAGTGRYWGFVGDLARKRSLNSLADDLSAGRFLQISIGVNGFNPRNGLPNGWPSRVANYMAALAALYLGVRVNSTNGAVLSVIPGGPAQAAGFHAGDVLSQLAGNNLRAADNTLSLPGLLNGLRGQTGVSLRVLRAGQALTVQLDMFDDCGDE